MSAAAVAWRSCRKDLERWEGATVKVIAIAFFALAAYVSIDAVVSVQLTRPRRAQMTRRPMRPHARQAV